MKERIVNTALENLEKHTGIKGNFTSFNDITDRGIDGKVDLFFDNGKEIFWVEVKKEVRNHQLNLLIDLAHQHPNFLLIAENIFPKIKEQLRKNNIAWLDIAGNIYLHTTKHHLWIEGQKIEKIRKVKVNRAFTATGAKVIYQFLINENFLNLPYREIAVKAGVALGNINYIINGLKEHQFLIKENNKRMKLINKRELLDKWMVAYDEKLKPTLNIGNFRFLNDDDYYQWQRWNLESNETFWGGEPAGEIITKYLKPEIFTIYTDETRNALIKKYRLVPDPNGPIKLYKKFWKEPNTFNPITVHPILAYTDLMNTGDGRCVETAKIIYEQYIGPNI